MANHNLRKVDAYLSTNHSQWQAILNKVHALQFVSKKVSAYLDTSLAQNCQVANVVGNKLIFVVENGAVATQIRYQASLLLMKFSRDPALKHIMQIECKVRPAFNRWQSAPHSMTPLSRETAALVLEMSENLSDPDLKTIMEKIAKHVENSG